MFGWQRTVLRADHMSVAVAIKAGMKIDEWSTEIGCAAVILRLQLLLNLCVTVI